MYHCEIIVAMHKCKSKFQFFVKLFIFTVNNLTDIADQGVQLV
jgi:hypothetical protein